MQVFDIGPCTVIEVAIIVAEVMDIIIGIVALVVQANVTLAQGVVIAT
jgi:hypothetical protein